MLKRWLFKINRITIWPLLVITIMFLLAGYSMTDRFYVRSFFPPGLARELHLPFCIAFLLIFLLHTSISIYFAILRNPSKPPLSIILARWSAWLLFVSTAVMLIAGYAINGTLAFIPLHIALQWHSVFSFLVVPLFVVHAGINTYYIVRKWIRN